MAMASLVQAINTFHFPSFVSLYTAVYEHTENMNYDFAITRVPQRVIFSQAICKISQWLLA